MTLPFIGELTADLDATLPLEVVSEPATEWPRLQKTWAELAENSETSIFMSPLWVSTWLETFSDLVRPSLVKFQSGGSAVAACLIVDSPASWARPLRRLTINSSGEPEDHTLYMEFNTLLCRAGWLDRVAPKLADLVRRRPWDEFELHGFSSGRAFELLKHEFSGFDIEERWQPSYYVDLAALRRSGKPYLESLGRARHVRQQIRYHGEAGELRLEPASDSGEALAMLDQMATLNSRRFRNLGRRGIWESDRFRTFHRKFVEHGFVAGTVQLLRVSAGSRLVGIIYNLVHRDKVYFYQCGYNYSGDKRLSPGVVTLVLAIEHLCALGFSEFDFLAGDASYKEWMSTGCRQLVWATFRRRNPRTWAYRRLRGLKNRILR